MDEELSALYKNNTWDLIPLSPSKSVVGCRWCTRSRLILMGLLIDTKLGWLQKGYSQQYGMDYEKTVAPIAKMTTICTLLVIASVRQ